MPLEYDDGNGAKRELDMADANFYMTPGSTMTIEPKAVRPQWEYQWLYGQNERRLNEMGQEGWQLVAVVQPGGAFIFIREVLPDSDD